ncbi:DUF2163 domain-containing protein [Aquamicrobium zhengzhouense]|uniref:DUF2163 domain-containing protein n=1 Tax=Aquamicrobium zhengzhouense TaxID=2781738 RepID=A0ABS0SBS1_9HYPH|nr:DUF2163 domain-containing protein [Aquamicrobium zhengzhouense]MBI1620749.1 DUF2163 domain-containing protein [Aquamicrobium zhengzhouense]
MSDYPPELRAHLEQVCTTLCHCWLMTCRDGKTLGFTDYDRPLEIEGQQFQPQSGFTQSEVRTSLGMAVDTAEVEGALSSDVLTDADILSGTYDGARIDTLLVNWTDARQFVRLRTATIGRIERRDGQFVAELESLMTSLDKPNGRILRRQCDAQLGDARCKVATDDPMLKGSGIVEAVIGSGTFEVRGLDGFPAGWFSYGEISWTSGGVTGRKAFVEADTARAGKRVFTLSAAGSQPVVGTTFVIIAGCDKSFQACREKFGNGLNFRGFPHLPGNDAAYRYVSDEMLHDGGALVE